MKKFGFFIFFLALAFLLGGCLENYSSNKNSPKKTAPVPYSVGQADNDLDEATGANNIKNANNNTNQAVKKFYPDTGSQAGGGSTADAGGGSGAVSKDFVITQELQVKFYLVDKYGPGVCYGLPGPVPDAAVSGMISRNQELAEVIRSKYSLTSDLDVYNKIKQLNGIQLTKLAGGKYQFNFVDGQCCILKAYEGEATIIGVKISDQILRQDSKENPC